MAREFELKLDVPPEALAQLKALPSLGVLLAGRPRKLVSFYYDTPKHTFRKHGLTLRIRRDGRRTVQTVKASENGDVIDRAEWEQVIQGAEPDLAVAEDTALGPLLGKKAVRKRLGRLFSTKVNRSSALLTENGTTFEISLDVGTVEGGPRSEPLCELELELKDGEPQHLFDFTRMLIDAVPVRLGAKSKSERGYALLDGAAPGPARAETPALRRDMTPVEAFQAIARGCVRQLMLNEALLRETRDENALHQTRVAARRLRAAIWFFKPALGREGGAAINGELRWIARLLGEARDLDVFLAETVRPRVQRNGGEGGDEALLARYERERNDAYGRVIEALQSKRFRALVLETVAWIETGASAAPSGDGQDPARSEPIKGYAAAVLKRRRKRFLKEGADLETVDDAARHALRIRAKKLRYAAEFLASLYRGKARKRHAAFVDALEELQTSLGALNDAAKARELASEPVPAGEGAPGTSGPGLLGLDGLADDPVPGSPAPLKKAVRAYEAFAEAKPFWR